MHAYNQAEDGDILESATQQVGLILDRKKVELLGPNGYHYFIGTLVPLQTLRNIDRQVLDAQGVACWVNDSSAISIQCPDKKNGDKCRLGEILDLEGSTC